MTTTRRRPAPTPPPPTTAATPRARARARARARSGGDDAAAGGEINMDEEVEVAEGTTLNLPDCPSDWDPMTGLTDDTIKIAMSLPESGPVAALAGLDDGMRAWFDGMEPIDGRTFELVSATTPTTRPAR
jgi:hypothetical protein